LNAETQKVEEEIELNSENINRINEAEDFNNINYELELEEESKSQELDKEDLENEIKKMNKNLIEGALYAAGRPIDIEELSTKLELSKRDTEELVKELAFDYLERSSALIIAQVGDKYQMQLRPEYTERVSKFAKGGAISEANLRTLTIIALKQPILKSIVVKIRGSGAYEHIKYLIDNELISAIKKGRTHELTTTDKYADMFGLPKNKDELKKVMITQLGLEDKQN